MKKLLEKMFSKKTICSHDWECAEIHQVRVENGQLVPFKIRTPQLLECKKCHKTKRLF